MSRRDLQALLDPGQAFAGLDRILPGRKAGLDHIDAVKLCFPPNPFGNGALSARNRGLRHTNLNLFIISQVHVDMRFSFSTWLRDGTFTGWSNKLGVFPKGT